MAGEGGCGGGGVLRTSHQIGVGRSCTARIVSFREPGNSEGQIGISFSFAFLFQEEQHRSHENCLDAASDDLLDLQRNLPERRGRGRELEEYRLRKEYLEHEVSSLLSSGCPGQISCWLGLLLPSPGCFCLRPRKPGLGAHWQTVAKSGVCEH